MTFAAAFPRTFSAPFKPDLAADVVASWWVVPGKTCVAAYQPKGAASLAASYVNLATPGTYDAAPGVVPTWSAATGWTGDGTSTYLTTGITPGDSWSVLVRFSGATSNSGGRLFGGTLDKRFGVLPNNDGTVIYETHTLNRVAPELDHGVLGFAARQGYRNGNLDGAPAASLAGAYAPISILCANGPSAFINASIQAIAIYSDTLTAGEVAVVSAAMAAL